MSEIPINFDEQVEFDYQTAQSIRRFPAKIAELAYRDTLRQYYVENQNLASNCPPDMVEERREAIELPFASTPTILSVFPTIGYDDRFIIRAIQEPNDYVELAPRRYERFIEAKIDVDDELIPFLVTKHGLSTVLKDEEAALFYKATLQTQDLVMSMLENTAE